MGILCNRLLIILNENSADSTYYHIAMMMLQNMAQLPGMTINEVAELCAVSKSTISKFIRELGYEDYADFRYATTFEDNKYHNAGNYVSDVMGYLEAHSMEEYLETVIRDLRETYAALDWAAVDRLVRDLASHERVAAFGLMFSETAAIDLQIKLGYHRKFIVTNINDLKQMEYVRSAGAETLILVFSESGEFLNRYKGIIDFSRKDDFSITRAKVVLITADEAMARDPRVAYSILFRRTDCVRTHRMVYQLLTDIIARKYREYTLGPAAEHSPSPQR